MSTTLSNASWNRLQALSARTGKSLSQVLDQLISLAATHPKVAAILAEAGLGVEDDETSPGLSFLDGDHSGEAAAHAAGLPANRPPAVLVVEDDVHSLELLRVRLEFLGCQVLSASTREAAMTLALRMCPDMFIVDLGLGADEQGGLKLIYQLRATEVTARIPIIIHSVYVQHQSELPRPLPRVEALLPKPFKMKQLVDLVATLCDVENKPSDVLLI